MLVGKEKMNNIPQPIKTVVTKPQEKLYVLRLEKDLIAFIKESILLKLESPLFTIHAGALKNSYYRLLSHQACQHYHLQHWNNGSNDIIVTLNTDGFDSEKFVEILDLKEDNSFTKICDYVQQRHNGTNGNTSEANEANPKIMRPKVIIKKESSKGSMPLADTLSEITQLSVFLTTGTQNGRANEDFAGTPNTSTPVLAGSDNIEHERASKEALYMKVREKIFQDQQDEENADDDDEEEEEEEDDDHNDVSDEDTANSSSSDTKSGFMNHDNTHKHNGYNALDPNSYQYNGVTHGAPPMPMGMPLNFNGNMNIPPFVNPNGYYNSPTQSMHPPQMNIYNQYANYFPAPHMMPPQNGFYSNAYNGNHYTPYDKETERKLLNNPYIIIPDSNRDKKPKKPYRGRYTNNNSNSSSSTSNISSYNSTKY